MSETDIINDDEFERLLMINDEIIADLSERYECRLRNNLIITEKSYGGYVHKALRLYDERINSIQKTERYLGLLNKTIDDFIDIDDLK